MKLLTISRLALACSLSHVLELITVPVSSFKDIYFQGHQQWIRKLALNAQQSFRSYLYSGSWEANVAVRHGWEGPLPTSASTPVRSILADVAFQVHKVCGPGIAPELLCSISKEVTRTLFTDLEEFVKKCSLSSEGAWQLLYDAKYILRILDIKEDKAKEDIAREDIVIAALSDILGDSGVDLSVIKDSVEAEFARCELVLGCVSQSPLGAGRRMEVRPRPVLVCCPLTTRFSLFPV